MASRRLRSAHNNSGGGCDGSADSRSFPKFKPVKNHSLNTCQTNRPRSPCFPPPPPPPRLCGRTHSIEKSQLLDGEVPECGQQICCSAHPDISGCCSARPAVVRRRETSDNQPRPYRPPPPLGGNCGRPIPLASLISIYNEPDNASDLDFEGEEVWEEGAEEGMTVTHSCPLSSASPEPRPCCCRRPPDQPQHMQVLLRSTAPQPANANHTEETPNERRQRRRQLRDLARAKKVAAAATVSTESTPRRKRSATQPPPQQRRGAVRLLQRPAAVAPAPAAAAAAPQQVRSVSQLMQPPRQPPQQQSRMQLRSQPWNQQQQQYQQQQYQQQQQIQQQQRLSQQQSPFRYDHLRSRSSPAPLYNVKIYNTSNMESGDDGYHDYEQQHQQQQQQQHIHRRPFAGLLRSRVSHAYNRRGRSSSASDV